MAHAGINGFNIETGYPQHIGGNIPIIIEDSTVILCLFFHGTPEGIPEKNGRARIFYGFTHFLFLLLAYYFQDGILPIPPQ
jgi:hypothetical protein